MLFIYFCLFTNPYCVLEIFRERVTAFASFPAPRLRVRRFTVRIRGLKPKQSREQSPVLEETQRVGKQNPILSDKENQK